MRSLAKSLLPLVAAGIGAFSAVSNAENVSFSRNSLNNRDVLVLAKAGFNEDFIIETILSRHTQFDTSVEGLADLAKQGMTERLIRVMMNCGESRPPAGASVTPVAETAVMPPIPPSTNNRSRTVRLSSANIALSTQTPYYESTSVLWGLWKKKIGVGTVVRQPAIPEHLGVLYEDILQRQILRIRQPFGGYQIPILPRYQPDPLYTVQALPSQP